MEGTGGQYRQKSRESLNPVFKNLGFERTPGVLGVLDSYHNHKNPELQSQYQAAMELVLTGAVAAHARDIEDVMSRPRVSKYRIKKLEETFNEEIVKSSEHINFPDEGMRALSGKFIGLSLNDTNVSSYERKAAAELVPAIGKGTAYEETVRSVIKHNTNAVDAILNGDCSKEQVERAMLSFSMLQELSITVEAHEAASVVSAIGKVIRENAGKAAAAGLAVGLAGSIMAPSAANAAEVTPGMTFASEVTSSSIQISSDASQKDAAVVEVAPVALADPNQSETISSSSSTKKTAKMSVGVGIATPRKSKGAAKSSPISIPAITPSAPQAAVPVGAAANATTDRSDQKSVAVKSDVVTEQQPAPQIATEVAPAPSSPASGQSNSVSVPVSSEATSGTPAPSSEKASKDVTPEQRAAQTVLDTITRDGDMSQASTQIRLSFAIESTNGSNNTITNKSLVKNVRALEDTLNTTIHAEGHSNVDYINTSLMALAVLDATANDQTVLQSAEVKALLVNVTRPTDEYQGKLFDQYLAKAKATLEANNSALLQGLDAGNLPSVETMYAYGLMAAVPDAEQAKEIQAIKDDEAAAETAPNQILETAIDRAAAQFGWSNNEKAIFQVAAQQGASAAAIAGLGGNVFAESGFNPAQEERGNHIGFGYIQESYGRRTAMERAAAAAGVSVSDPIWQANYVVNESKARAQRRDSSKNEWAGFIAITDPVAATDYWMYNNERPGIPHSATREAKATEIYNQINGQIQAIQRENEAAAAAKAKAAAEAAAEAAKHSNAQKIVGALEAEYAQWTSGKFRPLANGGNTNGIESYLKYSNGIHTSWCAFFVSYVLANAGLPVPTPEGLTSHAIVGGVKRALLKTGQFTWHDAGSYTPQAGDIAFYNGYGHINIVVSGKAPRDFDTIGGNEGNPFAPSYAAKYGGKKAYAYPHPYDQSYVVEENGNQFNSIDGFLSVNN